MGHCMWMNRPLLPGLMACLAWGLVSTSRAADGPATLRESTEVGRSTRVVVTFEADGTRPDYRKAKGADEGLGFRVASKLAYAERVLEAGPTARVARRVEVAEVAIGGFRDEGQSFVSALREPVSLLIAERKAGGVIVASAGGPLTRSELDLVQGPADPLMFPMLLPADPVDVGASWDVPAEAAKSLTEYDAIAVNDLKATLKSLDDDEARIALTGKVRGAVRGGEGLMALSGLLVFDRSAGLVRALVLNRSESRKAGPVESALKAKSTIKVERSIVEVPPVLDDSAIGDLPLELDDARLLLVLAPSGSSYQLLHDRDWHISYEDARRVILKRLEGGDQIAQCDLAVGQNAGPGRHQDLEQFKADIRSALGDDFEAIVGEGEIGGDPDGGFRYKLAVEGRPKESGQPLWYYVLAASPEGDQVVAIFTMTVGLESRFGDQDLRLMGSLTWTKPTGSADPIPPTSATPEPAPTADPR